MELTTRTRPLPPPSQPDQRAEAQKSAASTVYTALYDWQTRVILLEPAAGSADPLVAQLRTVELLHGPGVVLASGKRRRIGYTALSYHWGPPRFEKDIQLDGSVYPITQNLFDALVHLRDTNKPLTLWIDALCINQWDPGERSMQITNMMTIFSKASEVIAWIGRGSWNITKVIECLRNGYTHVPEGYDIAVKELLRRPWFRRVWVKQEVFAAARLFLQCGEDKLPWEMLPNTSVQNPAWQDWPDFMHRTLEIRLQIESGEEQNFYLDDPCPNPQYEEGALLHDTDIINVLRRNANSQASDPRDYIYGVLGMSRTRLKDIYRSSPTALALPVDYKRNVAQVFADMARYIMRRDRCLNVLLLSGKFGGTIGGCQLPSWVPDWRYYTSSYPWLRYARYKSGVNDWMHNEYTACADERDPFGEHDTDMILSLQGIVLGSVNAEKAPQLEDNLMVHPVIETDRAADKFLKPSEARTLENHYPAVFGRFNDLINREILNDVASGSKLFILDNVGLSGMVNVLAESPSRSFDESYHVLIPLKRLSSVRMRLLVAGASELDKYRDRNLRDNTTGLPKIQHTKTVKISVGDVRSKQPVRRPHGNRVPSSTREVRPGLGYALADRPGELIPKYWVVPQDAAVDDVVVLLKGGILPVVLRPPAPGDSRYRFIGPAALTEWTSMDPSHGRLRAHLDRYLWTYPGDQYTFLLQLLDTHIECGTLQTFHLG